MNGTKLVQEYERVISMESIDHLIDIDDIREQIRILVEYSLKIKTKETKKKYIGMANSLGKLIDFDNGLVYERGLPSIKKYFSVGFDSGIKYASSSVLDIAGNIQVVPINSLGEEEKAYNESCDILSKLLIIAEAEYNLDKLYAAFQLNLWLDNQKEGEKEKFNKEIYLLHNIDKNTSVNIEEFGERISLLILEKQIYQTEVNPEKILNILLDMNWVHIEKESIGSALQSLKDYTSRKGLEYGGIDQLNIIFDKGPSVDIRCDLSEFNGEAEEELKDRLETLYICVDEARANGNIITHLSFSHEPKLIS